MSTNYSLENLEAILAANAATPELAELVKGMAQKLGEYETATSPYEKILRLAMKCDFMKDFLENVGIDVTVEPTTQNIIDFTNAFSNEITFASTLWYDLAEYKKGTNEALRPEEVELIEAVNEHYITTYGIDFDVLDISIQKSLDNGEKVIFQPRTMRVHGHPGKMDVYEVHTLCLPVFYWADGELHEKAEIAE